MSRNSRFFIVLDSIIGITIKVIVTSYNFKKAEQKALCGGLSPLDKRRKK